MSDFNFTDESNSFAYRIGLYTPDKYGYEPKVGDDIDIYNEILGKRFVGTVVEINETPEDVKSILNKNMCGDYIEIEDRYIFNQKYFIWGDEYDNYLGTEAVDCNIVFNGELIVDKKKLKKSNLDLTSLENKILDLNETNIIFKDDKIEFVLTRINKNKFKINGKLRCFVDGHSVLTTKTVKDLKDSYQNSDKVENVAWSDGIVDSNLKNQLNEIVDLMCKKEKKDYHPGSGKTVRDIVHPSLYCYVDGVSKKKQKQKIKKYSYGDVDFWGRQYEDSKYQWLPAEFFVNEDSTVSINSYINNLSKEKYPFAYDVIAKIFQNFMPMFEKVTSNLRNDFYGTESKHNGEAIKIPLRNRKLQVVTKIVEYRVNAEQNFDGVWHVEGMSHENILATGLYIFKREDNFNGAEIEFRRFLYEDEGDEIICTTPQNANRQTDQMGGGDVKPLGKLETPEGRAIVFPNSHIHKLTNMVSSDGKDAVRRILVFWLVNPDARIISTEDVEPQQNTMSFKEAKKYQLELMKERKLHKESFMEREVFLCEH